MTILSRLLLHLRHDLVSAGGYHKLSSPAGKQRKKPAEEGRGKQELKTSEGGAREKNHRWGEK